MYVIIVGGGRVGASLTLELTELGHEVLVIEKDDGRSDQLRDELGSVVMTGDGCEVATMVKAGAERADILVAVTDGDEDNLVACQVAQHYFHVGRVVARINIPRNERIFRLLGIDCTMNAVEALTKGVLQQIPGERLTRLLTFEQDGLTLLGIRIPDAARAVGKKITEITLPEGSAVSLVVQGDHLPRIPSPDITLHSDDEVIVLARTEDEPAVVAALAR